MKMMNILSKEAILGVMKKHTTQIEDSDNTDVLLILCQHGNETTFSLIGSKEDLTNSLMSACVHNPEFSILLGDVIQNMILNWSIKEQIEEKELERMKHGDN
jgi:hypothetical protein